jgi:hypothetical protein
VLIPIKDLMNGTMVTQIDVATVTYYHIALPRHDVVLAEGGCRPTRILRPARTSRLGRVAARCSQLDRLFVAARAGFFGLGSDAAVLVFRPSS